MHPAVPCCIEGVRCCGDGNWACNEGDGSSTCGSAGEGQMCTADADCCEPEEEPGTHGNPICFEGARCCGDGSWACNEGDGSSTCGSLGHGESCR